MISWPVILLGLFATALLAASLGCGVGAVRSALRGQAVESALGVALTALYGAAFVVFAYLLRQSL